MSSFGVLLWGRWRGSVDGSGYRKRGCEIFVGCCERVFQSCRFPADSKSFRGSQSLRLEQLIDALPPRPIIGLAFKGRLSEATEPVETGGSVSPRPVAKTVTRSPGFALDAGFLTSVADIQLATCRLASARHRSASDMKWELVGIHHMEIQ